MTPQEALRQQLYLQALGIPRYVSRGQLPGAAASLWLELPAAPPAAPGPGQVPRADMPKAREPVPEERRPKDDRGQAQAGGQTAAPVRITVASIVAGGCLWLELVPGGLVSRELVTLVQAMACALSGPGERPQVEQFDWPVHNNRQLDLGEAAARVALGSFVQRRLDRHGCRAVLLLGDDMNAWLDSSDGASAPRYALPSAAAMLEQPALKRQAWQVLKPLCQRSL